MAVATLAPPLRIDPNAPRAAPRSSDAQASGAKASEQVSIIPTEKQAMNISAMPFVSCPGLSDTIAAEKAVSDKHELIKIQRDLGMYWQRAPPTICPRRVAEPTMQASHPLCVVVPGNR